MNHWFDNFPIISKYFSGKIILSFFMLLLSIMMLILSLTIDRAMCVFAMMFSFCGDIFLNHMSQIQGNSKNHFIFGGIAFIFAHMFYCAAYSIKIYENCYGYFNNGIWFAVIILSGVTIYMLIKATVDKRSKLFLFGLLYLWIMGINYMTVFSYAFSAKSIESFAMVGGLLFLASDVIIGLEKYTGLRSKLARELVWWFYPIGQIILILMA